MRQPRTSSLVKRVAVVSTFSPRQCGIATFASDLNDALCRELGSEAVVVAAINDREDSYDYSSAVRIEIDEADTASFRRAAEYLNLARVDVVNLQHEYGIFGGNAGSHVLTLLRELRAPVVTTLHTILRTPSEHQRRVFGEVLERSTLLIVMNEYSKNLLVSVHGTKPEKIVVIPHGIPDTKFRNPEDLKEEIGLSGKRTLMTFGLLSPDKGIEDVIRALPAIAEEFANTVYTVVGVTHPHIRENEGEAYRLSLRQLADRLGVSANLVFHDRFLSIEELTEFLGATDVYITPYVNSEQISSGTLAMAFGMGSAVVSTAYPCATELLANGRGVLVPQRTPSAIAEAVGGLLRDGDARKKMRQEAYRAGRKMVWSEVARETIRVFKLAAVERESVHGRAFELKSLKDRPIELPAFKLSHLRRMTDDTGLLQHAVFDVPNYDEGYCVDDNARALMLVTLVDYLGLGEGLHVKELAAKYMAFLWHSFNPLVGRFRNFMSYERRWLEKIGSEDSHGRALWALGFTSNRSKSARRSIVARRLFQDGLPAAEAFTSPRAWAFALNGFDEYLQSQGSDESVEVLREELVDRLIRSYHLNSEPDWRWYESIVAYSNAIIPYALIVSGRSMGREDAVAIGIESLEWLTAIQTSESGSFSPIGSHGHYRKGCECARFDQQPIEAFCTIKACLAAHRVTNEPKWIASTQSTFDWFLGLNDLGQPLYDLGSGGCRDGLHPDGVNENMGAESTLAFLLSLGEMYLAESTPFSAPVPLPDKAVVR
ncbi:MAG: glycosyltransferase family 4 protein [Armatimonadetes bacterium]|nr:glycosyltransferase family 4 protein [Armatimonadota bacterium]